MNEEEEYQKLVNETTLLLITNYTEADLTFALNNQLCTAIFNAHYELTRNPKYKDSLTEQQVCFLEKYKDIRKLVQDNIENLIRNS